MVVKEVALKVVVLSELTKGVALEVVTVIFFLFLLHLLSHIRTTK
jgi:hypothetical protein